MFRDSAVVLLLGGALLIVPQTTNRSASAEAAGVGRAANWSFTHDPPQGQVQPVSQSTDTSKKRRLRPSKSNPYTRKSTGSSRVPKHLRRAKQQLYVEKKLPSRTEQNKQQQKRREQAEAATVKMNDNLKRTGTLNGTHHPEVISVLRKSKAQKKLLFLIFTSQNVKICRRMQTECLGTEYVKNYMKDRYLVHVVDVDKKPGIADYYMFTPLIPHYKVIDANGTVIKDSTGYHGTRRFLDFLDR